ncbi:MAG: hypothetical protein R3B57_05280 [Phycisphaerales bacterium]
MNTDFLANAVSFSKFKLREVYEHFGKLGRAEVEISRLEVACDGEHLYRNYLFLEYMLWMQKCNWKEYPSTVVLDPLRRLADIYAEAGKTTSLGEYWNLDASIRFAEAGFLVRPEPISPRKGSTRKCDLFLQAPAQFTAITGTSSWGPLVPVSALWDADNIAVPGIAVECKSVSNRNTASEIRDAAGLLAEYGGGLLALDVSPQVSAALRDQRFESDTEFSAAVKAVLANQTTRVGRTLMKASESREPGIHAGAGRRNEDLSGIVGVMVRCRVMSAGSRSPTVKKATHWFDVEDFNLLVDSEARCIFESRPGACSQLLCNAVGTRYRRSAKCLVRPEGGAMHLKPGSSQSVIFGPDGVPVAMG